MVSLGRKGRKSKDGKGLTGYKGTSSSKANLFKYCINVNSHTFMSSFVTIIFLQISPFREVAAINVTNVNLIEEFVFSAAFSTFDQVEG